MMFKDGIGWPAGQFWLLNNITWRHMTNNDMPYHWNGSTTWVMWTCGIRRLLLPTHEDECQSKRVGTHKGFTCRQKERTFRFLEGINPSHLYSLAKQCRGSGYTYASWPTCTMASGGIALIPQFTKTRQGDYTFGFTTSHAIHATLFMSGSTSSCQPCWREPDLWPRRCSCREVSGSSVDW